MNAVIVKLLKKERDLTAHQLSQLDAALSAFLTSATKTIKEEVRRKRRPISAKGLAAIRRAQKLRWAKVKKAAK